MSNTFVVIWRNARRARWQVQPFIYGEAEAEAVGRRLVAQFRGEAWTLPVEIPPTEGEDASDLEE